MLALVQGTLIRPPKYEVVYYGSNGRQLWWPADFNLRRTKFQLRLAKLLGKKDARLSVV